MEKLVDKRIKSSICLLICLLCLCVLLVSCTPGGSDVTTDHETLPTPESSTLPPETTAAETDDVTTEEVTTEPYETTETTETTEIPEVAVLVSYRDIAKFYTVKVGETLPTAALEAFEIPTETETVKVDFKGWEYSAADGVKKPYDINDPPAVGADGMSVYPVIEFSYLVSFSAGEGKFPEGTKTSFFVKEGIIKISELLTAMPLKPDDNEYSYPFIGFIVGDQQLVTDDAITIISPMEFTAEYGKEELIYTVIARTEHGDLPSGGKTYLFEGNYSEAENYVASFDSFSPEDVYFDDAVYSFSGVSLNKEGREWTLELIWTSTDIRYTITFDYGDGQESVLSHISADGKAILPTGDRLEDKERYYDFVGWRDMNGMLYNGGYEITVNGDMFFTAEYLPGELKIYTVIFDTEIGVFGNGSPVIVLTGHYGEPILPPSPPELSELTFGEVVYEFVGWGGMIPETFAEDLSYTAVYRTSSPVYYLNFYINGEHYLSVPHYAQTPLIPPERPESTKGMVFSGWIGMPDVMPEGDTDIHAEARHPNVIYMLDGEVLSSTEAKAGTLVTIAAPAQRYGHTVSGWSTEDIEGLADGGFTMPERDVVFSASSSPNPHTVKYIIDGSEIYTDSVFFGDIYTVRGIEVVEGYEFTGWKLQSSSADTESGMLTISDADIVFVGSFEKCSYSVNYYLDGILIYSDMYFYGDTVALRPNEEQAGCTFKWNSAGADIASGSFSMPAGDVDIYGAFSAGDNSIVFMIDGKDYGSIGVSAGQYVDLGLLPTRFGYTFSGWSCDEVDVSEGRFIMPEGDILLRGSFIPNAHDILFIDMATDIIINASHLDYGASFSLGDRLFCKEGKLSDGWILLAGNAVKDGDKYIMPDSDVIFGIVWVDCLTVEIDEDYHIPYYALLYDEYGGCRYDEESKTVYISDPSIKVAGESEGITVVYEYEIQ